MTFTLQPGDWIPKHEVPPGKRQSVANAFAACGIYPHDKFDEYWDDDTFDTVFADENRLNFVGVKYWGDRCERRVTLEQILGEQPPSFETCSDCGGSGLRLNYNGEPDECRACGGDTVVEASFETRKPGDYVTIDQMKREAEHWQRVGPELLAALEYVQSNVYIDEGYGKFNLTSDFDTEIIDEAITKARSIK